MIKRLPAGKRIFFDIRIDKTDAKYILERPLEALSGQSWTEAFRTALKETVTALGNRAPETILLEAWRG